MKELLKGCKNLRRLGLKLRPGGITDHGLREIGLSGKNLTWVLLSNVGKTDKGLEEFSTGCPKLQTLEIVGCPFSGKGLVPNHIFAYHSLDGPRRDLPGTVFFITGSSSPKTSDASTSRGLRKTTWR